MTSWIRTPDELRRLVSDLEGCGAIAIDTEADSLHHYSAKVCRFGAVVGASGSGFSTKDRIAARSVTKMANTQSRQRSRAASRGVKREISVERLPASRKRELGVVRISCARMRPWSICPRNSRAL